jgi:rhamnogalacturonan endolyase
MLRGSSGFYCYAIFEHAREHPALSISVARLAFKLNAAEYINCTHIHPCFSS